MGSTLFPTPLLHTTTTVMAFKKAVGKNDDEALSSVVCLLL
jgi:hypothetical protein